MMKLATPGSLARAFAGNASPADLQAVLRQQATERERRGRKQDVEERDAELMDFALAMVAVTEIDDFRIEIDAYDTAAVAALYENERGLALVQEQMDGLLAKAHVLPDGRRVFKTEDGTRVFDENGQELRSETIDPMEIADERPRWEAYKPMFDERERLQKERDEIIRYQGKLDAARERLERDEISLSREGIPGSIWF